MTDPAGPAACGVRDRFRIVLVHPRKAGNVGAAARAAANMGFPAITVVDAGRLGGREALIRHRWARAWAAGASGSLAQVKVVPTLEEALAGTVVAVALTGRRRHWREPAPVSFPGLVPDLIEQARSGPVALLFGAEDRGLSADEMRSCALVAKLPASPEQPILNLASAVLVACYEIFRQAGEDGVDEASAPALATVDEVERVLELGQEVLDRVGFGRTLGTKDRTALESLLRRIALREGEYRFLMGAFQQLARALPEKETTGHERTNARGRSS